MTRPLGLTQAISATMRAHVVKVLDLLMAEVKATVAGDEEAVERDLVDEVRRWAERREEALFPEGRPRPLPVAVSIDQGGRAMVVCSGEPATCLCIECSARRTPPGLFEVECVGCGRRSIVTEDIAHGCYRCTACERPVVAHEPTNGHGRSIPEDPEDE
jgi:hypothetical protein